MRNTTIFTYGSLSPYRTLIKEPYIVKTSTNLPNQKRIKTYRIFPLERSIKLIFS